MNELHVGRGTTRNEVTVFPVWTARTGFTGCTTDAGVLEVSEHDDGPTVSTLLVGNPSDRPVLVLEGQLFEGGWQHRMAARSMVIGVHQRVPVEVACVEQGRWGGDARQSSRGRRATPYVRDAVRAGGDVQGEVWRRVAAHTRGTDNATGSLVRRLDGEASGAADAFRVLPGQSGLLIGVGGQPLTLEVFESQRALRSQFRALVEAALLDAQLAPQVATPSRRALRFVAELEQLWMREAGPAGAAEESRGRSERIDASALTLDGRDLHLRASYVAHPMLVAGGAL